MVGVHSKDALPCASGMIGKWGWWVGVHGRGLGGGSVMAIEFTEEDRVRGEGCVNMTRHSSGQPIHLKFIALQTRS